MSAPDDEPVPPVAVGDVVDGKYRVDRVLGHGAMGIVVAATHLQLEQVVAIKFLLIAASGIPLERFLREARATARLKGEHVCQVLDVAANEDEPPYIVMEHLAGRDLSELLADRGQLPVTEAVDYLIQACEGLAEAHSEGIVHRDLKPANLFAANAPDGTATVKLVDFGLSKELAGPEGPGQKPALTAASVMLGSPAYMSPEQMASPRDVDHRTDIWALGAVLYELLTGRLPFEAPTMGELVLQITKAMPTLPSQVRPSLPGPMDGIILRCLEKRPAERFPTVAHFAAKLAPLASEEHRPCALRAARLLGLDDLDEPSTGSATSAMPAMSAAASAMPFTSATTDSRPAARAGTVAMPAVDQTESLDSAPDPKRASGSTVAMPQVETPSSPAASEPTAAAADAPGTPGAPADPTAPRAAAADAPGTPGAPADPTAPRPAAPDAHAAAVSTEASVSHGYPPATSAQPHSEAGATAPRRSPLRWIAFAGGALALVAVVVVLVLARGRTRRPAPDASAKPAPRQPCDHPPSSKVEIGGAEPTGCSAFWQEGRICLRCKPAQWGPLEDVGLPPNHADTHLDIKPTGAHLDAPLPPGAELRIELLWGEQSRFAALRGPGKPDEPVGMLEPVLVPVWWAPAHRDCKVVQPVLLIDGCERQRDLAWATEQFERMRVAGAEGFAELPEGFKLVPVNERGELHYIEVRAPSGLLGQVIHVRPEAMEIMHGRTDERLARIRLDVQWAWWSERRDGDGRLRYRRLPMK